MTATHEAQTQESLHYATEALPEGTTLLGGEFTILNKMGNGGFGITYLAADNFLNRNVVIKECFPETFCSRTGCSVHVRTRANHDKYRSIVDMFTREARSIAKLRHPNIIGVHRIFEDNGTAYIALDLIDGQDLLKIIKEGQRKLSPEQVRDILIKLLDAVQMVHSQDLLHRDISPDNILLDKWGNPVLIDFGAAREEASRETRALSSVLVVKDGYSPQEFYFAGGKQTPASDLYALASTFYHVVSGKAPPNSQTRMAEVAAGNPDPCNKLAGRFDDYDDAFLKAIDQAMAVAPRDRIQSAADWRQMIDPTNVPAEPYMLPKSESSLEKVLTRLVSETNEQMAKAPDMPERKPRHQARQQPKPQMPAWIHEFNQETIERKKQATLRPQSAQTQRLPTNQRDIVVEESMLRTGRVPLKSVARAGGYAVIAGSLALMSYTTVFAG